MTIENKRELINCSIYFMLNSNGERSVVKNNHILKANIIDSLLSVKIVFMWFTEISQESYVIKN